ncbi:hypothetical protein Rhal01_01359 [Rubritalea halochordaticola]|uniref:3-keto-alpha-glucoside-1,2-lyase/3-keto-2-hydroxy-glucal hydratase domain-containing protein n=1 Tax=Rubritalea halochordaticola TaxID=714537 RepID=A0ABP9V0Q2_9BACT
MLFMKQVPHTLTVLFSIASLATFALGEVPKKTWTDAKQAASDFGQFDYVGEYLNAAKDRGIQVTVLTDGTFYVRGFAGGLPGEGWDGKNSEISVLNEKALVDALKGYEKVQRQSPTLGKKAPTGAVTMPDGFTKVKDGLLQAGGKSRDEFGSFKMHVEFLLPFKPHRNPSNQDKGNSGIYIFNNYEIQVLDSFGLDYKNREANKIKLESANEQWCGCLYKMKKADLNMSYPPLTWQTYDIEFNAPVMEGEAKVKNARLTLWHNGVKIHDDVELKTGTGAGALRKQVARGPIYFQNHGNPTVYRNVWIQPVSDKE